MCLCLIIFVALLVGCGPVTKRPPKIPADLFQPEPGWQGPPPATEGDLIDAALAERNGRVRANGKLETIKEIVVGPDRRPIRCNFFNCGV